MATTIHEGSCLCGAVTYEADALPGPALECHCRTCRKAHGSAFKVGTKVLREAFRWTRGDAERRGYESSPGKQRWFCSRCGTHLASERPEAPFLMLSLATLDTEPGFGPSAHIWVCDKASWFDPDPRLPAHETYPPSR